MTKPSILVFAYHDVGYECLHALIENDEHIMALITHRDNPDEEIWFRSVAQLAHRYDIPVHTPETVNTPDWTARIRHWGPDLIFSFYYRNMISADILAIPPLGAYNLHGSLLPNYRGRAPINWAILKGETRTGVTLHHMVKQADAGDIVDQEAFPIDPGDTALDVFRKATAAARAVIERQIENIKAGTAPRAVQNGSEATSFGGRRPEDGRIDWAADARSIYNLVRAVTHPYPGAFTTVGDRKLFIWWAQQAEGDGKPGEVLSLEPLRVATGAGSLEIVNGEWEDDQEGSENGSLGLSVGQILGT
jgi:methionyl-tRNA formyltransferase